MRLSLFCPLTLAALALVPPAAAQRTSLQIVVRDSSGLSIPFASAVVFPDGRIVGADQHGHIPISGLQVGLDTVMVRAIGFHPLLVPVRRISTPGFALTVTMARAPYVLPEVSVSSEESYDPIRAFHERARGSGGRFVARWQIARTGYIHASQTLQMVLGEGGRTDKRTGIDVDTFDPGMIVDLPPGRDVKVANPPTASDHQSYCATTLRGVAAGIGVTYEDLTGDYSAATYSSARMARNAHIGDVHDWRWNMLIPQFCVPVWEMFKESTMLECSVMMVGQLTRT